MKKTTIVDVARDAGVSIATVSRVINDDPAVGKAYRERVEAAISRLQYRPQLAARSVRSGHTRLIGMLVPRFDLQTFCQLADGAMQEAAVLGYHIVMMSSEGSSAKEMEQLLHCSALPLDGLILRPVSFRSDFDQVLARLDRPVVGVNMAGAFRPTLSSGAGESAYLATRYLLRIGRKRIALMVPFREQHVASVQALHDMAAADSQEIGVGRYLGYRRALEEAGVAFDPSVLLFYGYTQEGATAPHSSFSCRTSGWTP